MAETILTNACLVLSDEVVRGTLVWRDGEITDVGSGASAVPGAVDCEGDYVLPGLVELHTDNVERHMMPRPGSVWPTSAAIVNHDRELASVGITTVFDALTIGDFSTSQIRIALSKEFCPTLGALAQAGALKVDHKVHLRCELSSGSLLDLLETMFDRPEVGLVSVMDHTPGQRQFAKIEKYRQYYQGKFHMTDEAFEVFYAERVEDQKTYGELNRRTVVAKSKELGLPLASHDDATTDHVDEAIRDGVVLAEFPTTMEAAQASSKGGLAVLMGGPNLVRGKSHSGNIAARELATAGLLDVISSDYVPSSLLYGAMLLARPDIGVPLHEAIAMITSRPAATVGLSDRGTLTPGLRADVVRAREIASGPLVMDVWRGGQKIA
ncbi:MAG: alpha-D-ribose 1-methylphosphonate 5-triphosphate diphosphatase [Pseudomonadota bacterium]